MSSYALSWDNIIWLYLILFGHSIGFKKCICFENGVATTKISFTSNAFEDPIKRWCRAYYYPKSIMLISTNLWGLFVHLFINTGKLRSIKVNQGQLRSIWSWSALKKAQVQNWEKQRVSLTSTVRRSLVVARCVVAGRSWVRGRVLAKL